MLDIPVLRQPSLCYQVPGIHVIEITGQYLPLNELRVVPMKTAVAPAPWFDTDLTTASTSIGSFVNTHSP